MSVNKPNKHFLTRDDVTFITSSRLINEIIISSNNNHNYHNINPNSQIMEKLFLKALAAAAMLFTPTALMAQMPQVPAAPVDSAVRIGKLDNGLTYYIRHNETPKGQADFFIAQKVGSALEEDNQRGLAHFLEHMCFNGTKNFPGNSLIDWLETVGVKFGQNLNAYTSIDETVYNISSVPVARTGVQDSCLLILHDWADDLLLNPEEINKERGVIHQEWRRAMAGQMRILENQLPVLYPNNRYGYRLPIGTMEVVDNFEPQVLRDYYETWYRPDQQGIIVVGDIDPDYIEGKIKEIFSDIKMPENVKERTYIQVEDTPGTIWAIGRDKEMTNNVALLMFKQKEKLLPDEMRGTMASFPIDYLKFVITDMLDQRLDELTKDAKSPVAQAGIDIDNFFVAKTKDALTLQVVAKGKDITPAIKDAYRELLRAVRGGFTVSEYERAKAKYLANLEDAYNKRASVDNTKYAREYVRNFVDQEAIPGIEFEYNLGQQIAASVPLQAVNQVLPELVGNDNRAFLVMVTEAEDVVFPTESDLNKAIADVDAETIEPYKEETKSEPLIPSLPKAVAPKSVKELAEYGATEMTFPNGVKVIVKPTKFKDGDIRFDANAKGGLSSCSQDDAASLLFLPYALTAHGLGTYTDTDIQKYLSGKQTKMEFSFDSYSRSMEGQTTPKNLQTLMELIYATFTSFDITPEEFDANQQKFAGILANQELNPQYIFSRELTKALYKAPSRQAITSADIKAAKREAIINATKDMLVAPDYTFVFVGDIDMTKFTELASQYLGTLPKGKTVKFQPSADFDLATGLVDKTETTKMETPQTWVFIGYNAAMPYTAKNRALASITGQILSNRLLKKIREEMGAVYSIGAGANMSRVSKQNTVVQIPFPMKPEMKAEVLTEIDKMVNDMAENIKDEELNPIKEFMVKSAKENLEKNEEWSSTLSAISLNGVNTFTNAVDTVSAITTDDVKAFVKALIAQGNKATIILDPAQ